MVATFDLEICYWNKALTAEEVKLIYANEASGDYTFPEPERDRNGCYKKSSYTFDFWAGSSSAFNDVGTGIPIHVKKIYGIPFIPTPLGTRIKSKSRKGFRD